MLFYSNSWCHTDIDGLHSTIHLDCSYLKLRISYVYRKSESFKSHLYSHEVAVSLRGHILEHVALIQYQALQRQLAKKFPVVWLTNTYVVAEECKANFHW